jgi:hypothetical protein
MRTYFLVFFVLFIAPLFAQDIQIKDIQLRDGYRFSKLTDENFRFIYKIKSRDPNRSLFRKIDFTNRLQVIDTTLINLWGNYELLATTTSGTHTATLFGSWATSSLLIHFIDNQTEAQIAHPLQIAVPWRRKSFVQLYSSPQSNAIYFLYRLDSKTWELQQIDLQGKSVWSKRFTDPKKIQLDNLNLLTDNRLAFVKVIHPGSRKAKNEILVLEGTTGNDIYTSALYDAGSKSTVDNIIVRDSILYIAGRKFFKNRVSQNETGLPYLRQIESQQASDIKLTSSLLNLKTFWMDIVAAETGERYLIGETFTNEPYGAYLMKGVVTGVMTLGLFYVSWTSMKFKQVAIIPLDNPNAPPISLVELTPRRIQLGNYTPGYPFANYSFTTGQIRYWGHDVQGNIILMDGGLLKRYNLITQATEELGRLPENSSQSVIYTAHDYVVYLNQRKANNLVEFKAIPLSK